MMKRLEERSISYAFRNVVKAGPWNVDPSSFSNEVLLRFFGIQPRFE